MFCFQKEELLNFGIRLCQKNLANNLKNHKKWIAHLFENKIPHSLKHLFIKYIHLLDNMKNTVKNI